MAENKTQALNFKHQINFNSQSEMPELLQELEFGSLKFIQVLCCGLWKFLKPVVLYLNLMLCTNKS